MSSDEMMSTAALAKKIELSSKELFQLLASYHWITHSKAGWELTALGREVGGDTVVHPQHGAYIAWPPGIVTLLGFSGGDEGGTLLSAAALGERLGCSAERINQLLAGFGWLTRGRKGWLLSTEGTGVGGVQGESRKSGASYVSWPESMVSNPQLLAAVRDSQQHTG